MGAGPGLRFMQANSTIIEGTKALVKLRKATL